MEFIIIIMNIIKVKDFKFIINMRINFVTFENSIIQVSFLNNYFRGNYLSDLLVFTIL